MFLYLDPDAYVKILKCFYHVNNNNNNDNNNDEICADISSKLQEDGTNIEYRWQDSVL